MKKEIFERLAKGFAYTEFEVKMVEAEISIVRRYNGYYNVDEEVLIRFGEDEVVIEGMYNSNVLTQSVRPFGGYPVDVEFDELIEEVFAVYADMAKSRISECFSF